SIDRLIYEIIELLGGWFSPRMTRKRDRNESSPTASKPPSFLGLIDSVPLLKAQEKTEPRFLAPAISELASDVDEWSDCFPGKVEFLLCWAAAGDQLQFCMLTRNDHWHPHKLGPQYFLHHIQQRVCVIRSAITIHRILSSQVLQLSADYIPLGHEHT
ncbi:hypothetical protein WJX73_005060, partial [Symbiochloris irregularis]